MNKWIASLLVLPLLLLGMAAAGEGAHALEAKLKVGAGYQIRVEDQHGEGVQGAYVNICTDTMCVETVTTSSDNSTPTGSSGYRISLKSLRC